MVHGSFDPNYTSCTSFLAYIGSTEFGFNTEPVAGSDPLRHRGWLREIPYRAGWLTLIIESTQDPEFIPKCFRC